MDFIEGPPIAQNNNVFMVVIYRFNKFGDFVPLSHPYTAVIMATLFINNIFKLHGLLKLIVSNRDLVFLNSFWASLFSL